MTSEHFPILGERSSVPWAFVEQCRGQAELNHRQSLEQLAKRGGLSWAELYMCITKQRWAGQTLSDERAKVALLRIFNEWLVEVRHDLSADHIETVKRWYTHA